MNPGAADIPDNGIDEDCDAQDPGEVPATMFRRGDANSDGRVDLADAVASLSSLFLREGLFLCDDAVDANDDGSIDVSDSILTLLELFDAGPTIPAPGSQTCGFDETRDELACSESSECP